MARPFIDEIHIRNYGCIGDLALKLTPLHALIGPNDSGKSTVLRAIRTLTHRAVPITDSDEVAQLHNALITSGKTSDVMLQATAAQRSYRLQLLRKSELYETTFQGTTYEGTRPDLGQLHPVAWKRRSEVLQVEPALMAALGGSQLLRLDPDYLRQPTSLIPDNTEIRLANNRGLGLPSIYDAIITRDLPSYTAINEQIAKLFPTVKALSLKNPNQVTKALGVQLRNGTQIGAEAMSEGLLYFLAFAALPYIDRGAVVLIEEPENGLHPARIAEVMRVLRAVSQSTQVIMATHSPLVVNELAGNEVTVLTRSAERAVAGMLLQDTPNFAERSKVYELGELWVSYANGTDEAPLVRG